MEGKLGSIEIGKQADLIILDGSGPNLRPLRPANLISNIVYSANAGNVKTSVCGGQVLMRDRKVLTLEENEILCSVEAVAQELMGH